MDRISISNGAIDRTVQSNLAEDVKSSSISRQFPAAVSDDTVSLSGSARDAERLTSMMDDSRAGRLDAVREALANGTYSVSGSDIAAKLIDLNTR
jgi:flagellar biosynthesis anti-sigma factor FlgM